MALSQDLPDLLEYFIIIFKHLASGLECVCILLMLVAHSPLQIWTTKGGVVKMVREEKGWKFAIFLANTAFNNKDLEKCEQLRFPPVLRNNLRFFSNKYLWVGEKVAFS